MKCTRTDTDTESTLKLEGSLDALTVSDARPLFDAVGADTSRAVVVDLSKLTMIDSSGVGLILALAKRLRAEGRAFHVRGAQDQPLMVIKVLKLQELFGIEEAAPAGP